MFKTFIKRMKIAYTVSRVVMVAGMVSHM